MQVAHTLNLNYASQEILTAVRRLVKFGVWKIRINGSMDQRITDYDAKVSLNRARY